MKVPCTGCKHEDRCDEQKELARKVWVSWIQGIIVDCLQREEPTWRGLEGVRA